MFKNAFKETYGDKVQRKAGREKVEDAARTADEEVCCVSRLRPISVPQLIQLLHRLCRSITTVTEIRECSMHTSRPASLTHALPLVANS